MARVQPPWAPPLVELSIGVTGHLLCWEKVEADGSWWAWVSWVHESGGRVHHKVVQVRADTLRPLEPPGAYKDVPLLGRPLRIGGEHRVDEPEQQRPPPSHLEQICHDRGFERRESGADDRPSLFRRHRADGDRRRFASIQPMHRGRDQASAPLASARERGHLVRRPDVVQHQKPARTRV